jgi:diguanylate cyclase (GGDEF)-like protein/PAS domain S-box-containing protein
MSKNAKESVDTPLPPGTAFTVFIVDDDPALGDSLKLLLESAGLNAEVYPSAEAFLGAYTPDKKGCLVVDLCMPGITGLEMQTELTARQITIPVVLMTGHADVPMAIRAFRAGAADLIEKPFDNQAFLGRIKEVLVAEAAGLGRGRQHALPELPEKALGEKLAHLTLASMSEGVITTDSAGTIEYLNPIAERYTGWRSPEAKGKRLEEVFVALEEMTRQPMENLFTPSEPQNRTSTEEARPMILIPRDGGELPIDTSVAQIRDRSRRLLGYVIMFHDATQARRAARQLTYYASHDSLTGLVNRREFERRLERALKSARENDSVHVLCYLDLDRFKVVNDTAGHAAGDQLLRQLGVLLRTRLRQRDTLARIGGDEFALLLEHCPLERAQTLADELRRSVQEFRFIWRNRVFSVGASIGVAVISATSKSASHTMQAADAACFRAKTRGRNLVQVHVRDDQAEAGKMNPVVEWFTYLDKVLREHRLQLYRQAIRPVNDAPLPGGYYEVLVRMTGPSGDILPAAAFLPGAERRNLAADLDRWVIAKALALLEACPEDYDQLELCAFNLSRQLLRDETFPEFLDEQLARSGVEPSKLCFEFDETVVTNELPEAVCLLEALKAAGCRIAIDDFASTPPGFSYLKQLPVDFLKIDGRLVREILTSPVSCAMVKSIGEIARVMGIRTVAKCVENQAILDSLRELGMDYAQGYHVAEPVQFKESD